MANNLNNIRVVQEAWQNALASYTPKYTRVGRAMSGPAGSVRISGHAMGGIAQTVPDSGSVSAQDFASFEATFATAEKVILHEVATHKLQTEAHLLDAVKALAVKAGQNIDRDFFSGVEGLLSATSPRAGTGVGQVGSAKLYIDTGKKGLQGESGEFTYANKVASDLDETALDSAFSLMRSWRDDRGLPMGLGNRLVLVCNPADYKKAHELTKSVLSGSDNASNIYSGLVSDIVDYPFADTDAWFLVDIDNTPVGYYMAAQPSIEIRPDSTGLKTYFVAKYHGAFVYSPYEYGLVASPGA